MRKYSTIDKERKVFAAVMIIIILLLITWMVLEICGVFDAPVWKPDKVYPLANANVSWEQSFHHGSW